MSLFRDERALQFLSHSTYVSKINVIGHLRGLSPGIDNNLCTCNTKRMGRNAVYPYTKPQNLPVLIKNLKGMPIWHWVPIKKKKLTY